MNRTLRGLLKTPYQELVKANERWRYRDLWTRQLSFEDANQFITESLLSDAPCLIGRCGHTECRIVGEWTFYKGRFGRLTKKEAHQYSGIFPVNAELLSQFAQVYSKSISSVDLLGFWHTSFQPRLLSEFHSHLKLAPLSALEPYLHAAPWSAALAGRRVLVVHPFSTSIGLQYRTRRGKLFDNTLVLPDFSLQVLNPPQTLAPFTGGYRNWIDALNDLTEKVLQHQFDVALLGCGAYGLPLGAAIKAAGKQAIHLGGALQVLFGIRGKRWEKIPTIAALMNEHWVRASKEETPFFASLVDEGCYW